MFSLTGFAGTVRNLELKSIATSPSHFCAAGPTFGLKFPHYISGFFL